MPSQIARRFGSCWFHLGRIPAMACISMELSSSENGGSPSVPLAYAMVVVLRSCGPTKLWMIYENPLESPIWTDTPLSHDGSMYVCHIWSYMATWPPSIHPSFVGINLSDIHGSVMGIAGDIFRDLPIRIYIWWFSEARHVETRSPRIASSTAVPKDTGVWTPASCREPWIFGLGSLSGGGYSCCVEVIWIDLRNFMVKQCHFNQPHGSIWFQFHPWKKGERHGDRFLLFY